mmetsp:Transcript_133835/g.236918  ORF Transcript_133835/g.236918 Transcript_133835/m.236918 type:complete len:219 (-) Transcript_133835:114-770(-)
MPRNPEKVKHSKAFMFIREGDGAVLDKHNSHMSASFSSIPFVNGPDWDFPQPEFDNRRHRPLHDADIESGRSSPTGSTRPISAALARPMSGKRPGSGRPTTSAMASSGGFAVRPPSALAMRPSTSALSSSLGDLGSLPRPSSSASLARPSGSLAEMTRTAMMNSDSNLSGSALARLQRLKDPPPVVWNVVNRRSRPCQGYFSRSPFLWQGVSKLPFDS